MDPQSILVRMPNWVGDLVMATPVLTDLREAFPKASITAICRAPISDLLKEDSAIDELFSFTKMPNSFLRREERRNIIAKIAAGKYDLGVLLTNSFSSAWWFWQGNVKRRLGYSTHLRGLLLTDPMAIPRRKMHQVDEYKKLLEPLGIRHSKTKPRLFISEQEARAAQELLHQRGYTQGKKLIGINPGASYGSAKCWPSERFRALAKQLVEEGSFIVFFGDVSNARLVKDICQGLPERVINLAGLTSLRELSCLISDLDLLVTNDSGPMHIAAAFGTPLVALFGSTDDALTGPYGQREAVINKQTSCSPCFKRVCPIDFRCMKGISVEEVIEKVRAQLKREGRVD